MRMLELNKRALLAFKFLTRVEPALIVLASLIASTIRFGDFRLAVLAYPGFPKTIFLPLIWLIFLSRNHVWDKSIFHFSDEYYSRIIKSGWQALILFSAIAFLFKYPISRFWVLLNTVMIFLSLIIFRFLIRKYILNIDLEPENLNYLYIGSSKSSENSLNNFYSAFGFKPNIIFMEGPKNGQYDFWLQAYKNKIGEFGIYGVIIGIGEIQDSALLRELVDTERNTVIDFVLATRIGAISNRFEKLEAPNIVRIRESSLLTGGALLKRTFDIVFATIFLVTFSPILVLVSILVKLTSSGPIFYIDRRVGLRGKLFAMPKFRSMYKNADRERMAVLGRPDAEMLDRYKSDPRITPFGRFIRRWSIDELPQFWCVLMGSMSVVGPRPVLKEELSQIPSEYEIRFMAKPGLTGLWQVTGRKEVPWQERMVRDISYIDNWNFSYDLVLIFKTIGAIFRGQGAH